MEGILLKMYLVFVLSIAITLTMDFKLKNFIPGTYNNLLVISLYLVVFAVRWSASGFSFESYDSFNLLIFPAVFILINIVFIKAKFYFFKGMDKKFVKKNRNEITEIIREYKCQNLQGTSDISLGYNKVIFEKVSESQIKECLSLVGKYLDDNRKKYTFKDYLVYYIKAAAVPAALMGAFLLAMYYLYNLYSI